MKSLGWRCETEAYVQRGCFIHAMRGRTAATTDMEHLVPSKRIRSREIAADDKFQFKRQRAQRFKALHRVVRGNEGDVV